MQFSEIDYRREVCARKGGLRPKIFMIMRWTVFFMFVTCMAASARSHSQTVRLTGKAMTLPALFKAVRSQTGYVFAYGEHVLDGTKEVRLPAGTLSLIDLLDKALHPQGLQYSIESKTIVVTKALANKAASSVIEPATAMAEQPQETIRGRVVDSLGNPLPGATIKIKGTTITAIADRDGHFTLETADAHPVLEISYIGYQTATINGNSNTLVVLHERYSELDETIMQAYGKTSRRYNTGNISKVTAQEIEEQPVGNVLQALQGRVPGLNVTTSSGVPGASVKIQVRGQNSIFNGNDPLILIDGVPYGPNNSDLNTLNSSITTGNAVTSASSGMSPFSFINPLDIESIEVLKDADATAIYGSRGANGVILITTKKGTPENMKIGINAYTGINSVTRLPKMMNTQQYLTMRREAFANDGITPDQNNAPDLVLWDTTRNTDLVKEFFGGHSHSSNINASISGGNKNTQYLVSGTYRNEQNIFQKDLTSKTGTIYSSINSSSNDNRFKSSIRTSYTYNQNKQIGNQLGNLLLMPPDVPPLKDSAGNLIWYYNGVNFQNPLSSLNTKYVAKTDNLNIALSLSYEIIKGLTVKSDMGYNKISVDEINQYLSTAQNPQYGTYRSASFGKNNIRSYIIEPQIEYLKAINKSKFNVLFGTTFQSSKNEYSSISASGQSSDELLNSMSAASSLTVLSDNASLYKYNAFFARINYNLENTYLINITGRRDGSSRFGINQRFANFGAIGMGWIFSNENFVKNTLPVISFGKLRGSYGVTGNDQIGNYQYFDSWSNTSYAYNGIAGLQPARLANDNFSWERNKKLEFGLELGFFNDNLSLSTSWFQNRSDNQLMNYQEPSQTGFTTIVKNFPGLVQNRGWEITTNIKAFSSQNFSWSIGGNITIPRNKLLAFPGLEQSSYASTYSIGQSLSNTLGYKYTGVDKETGLFTFLDSNGDGTYDRLPRGDLAPKYYGGLSNNFRYRNFGLDIFFEFKKQLGYSYLISVYNNFYPGMLYGLYPVELLNHWSKPGDNSDIQRLTVSSSSDAYNLAENYFANNSTGLITDASYIRLKTLSFSYNIPKYLLKKAGIADCKLYFNCQNLFTITGYKVTDPETRDINTLAPLRTFATGIQLFF